MSKFSIGDKVLCIDASIPSNMREEISKDFEIWVEQDKTYTIRGFLDNDGIVVGVLLEEVHNFPKYFKLLGRSQEPAFRLDRFRKQETISQTIKQEKYETV